MFDDQTERVIDFEPILSGPVFGPLKDKVLFNQVTLDEFGTLEWPNGADIAPVKCGYCKRSACLVLFPCQQLADLVQLLAIVGIVGKEGHGLGEGVGGRFHSVSWARTRPRASQIWPGESVVLPRQVGQSAIIMGGAWSGSS
jgi:hypothetical protein